MTDGLVLWQTRPPLKFDKPLEIFRMIRCIMWISDTGASSSSAAAYCRLLIAAADALDAEDVWATPNFLMDLRKGDSEDHAILFANLLLGLVRYCSAVLCSRLTRRGGL
jgi:hypothetical protein